MTFEGANIIVRSLIDREDLDFSNVFISYVDMLDYRAHRREHLRKY